ncbi:hypothetical protein BCD49_16465 [Pseudofrankia sp. EUN1h]|nr:hypothetical protein BCD49_16465 [Pseudofrankia sp. EUN1h]
MFQLGPNLVERGRLANGDVLPSYLRYHVMLARVRTLRGDFHTIESTHRAVPGTVRFVRHTVV